MWIAVASILWLRGLKKKMLVPWRALRSASRVRSGARSGRCPQEL